MRKIRMAKKEDARAILSIYAPYVKSSAATFEYDVPTLEEFENRMETILQFFPYLVVEEEGDIIGYAYASFFRTRIAYQYSCELSVYVKEGYHGKRVGSFLYEVLEQLLKRQNFQNLNACITYPNDISVAFHEKRGYVKNAHFHKCGYKFNRWYDMIWMEKWIGEHTEIPEKLKSIKEINVEDVLDESIDS